MEITLGTTVATKKGLGLIVGFGECVGELLVELETAERMSFMEKELMFLSK